MFQVLQCVKPTGRFEVSVSSGGPTRDRHHIHLHRPGYQGRRIPRVPQQCTLIWRGEYNHTGIVLAMVHYTDGMLPFGGFLQIIFQYIGLKPDQSDD